MGPVETEIHHPRAHIFKAGLKFLPVGPLIQLPGGTLQFLHWHVAALFGRKLEGPPADVSLSLLEQVVEVIEALWRADEQRPALLIAQRRPQLAQLIFEFGKIVHGDGKFFFSAASAYR